MKTPDKSLGGTFLYDEDGKFIRHIPSTRLPTDAPAEPTPADDVKPSPPRGTRRQTTTQE